MACVSDVDLATLHRARLEERVHYKLSYTTRHYGNLNYFVKTTKNISNNELNAVNCSSNLNNNAICDKIKSENIRLNEAVPEVSFESDCSYFSKTLRRRRLGTWP